MFIIEHPLKALFIALGALIFFKVLFAIANFLENLGGKKKSEPKKETKKEPAKEEVKPVTKETSDSSKNSAVATTIKSNYDNYLYDRFVVTPTIEDLQKNDAKISEVFLRDKEAKEIKDKKLDIHVEPLDVEKRKSARVYEILQKYESKDKLLDDFESMPREMKLLILENIMKNM